MNAQIPPRRCASAITWYTSVVLPEDSGPKTSTMRPRGSPPIPRARSSASEPVETAPTETAARSFIFMTAPLPKFRSIWPRAVSSACSLSTCFPSQKNGFEDDVLRPGWAKHRKVSSSLGRHDRPEVGQGRPKARPCLEAEDGHVRQPPFPLDRPEEVSLETEGQGLGAVVGREDEHPDAPRLAVGHELEAERLDPGAAPPQRLHHFRHTGAGLPAEEREREVEVVPRHGPAAGQAELPCGDRVGRVVGKPQATEEPNSCIGLHASPRGHAGVSRLCADIRRTRCSA